MKCASSLAWGDESPGEKGTGAKPFGRVVHLCSVVSGACSSPGLPYGRARSPPLPDFLSISTVGTQTLQVTAPKRVPTSHSVNVVPLHLASLSSLQASSPLFWTSDSCLIALSLVLPHAPVPAVLHAAARQIIQLLPSKAAAVLQGNLQGSPLPDLQRPWKTPPISTPPSSSYS